MSPSEKAFYSILHKKNCVHHAYVDDVALPSEIYSWYLHSSEIGILDNNPLRKTCLLVLTPSENLIYLRGVDIKWNGPVLAPKGKSKSAYTSFISDTVRYWPGLLEAWLVLTSVKYHGNLYILSPLNQWLALTRLRATSPWWRGCSLVLQCFVENCREGEIYVVVGKVS